MALFYKRINGKKYGKVQGFNNKGDALKAAKKLREKGYSARVHTGGGETLQRWTLWARKD